VARIEVGVVDPLEEGQVLVDAARHRRRGGEQLEVVRLERRRPVGVIERRVGVGPGAVRVRLPAILEVLAYARL